MTSVTIYHRTSPPEAIQDFQAALAGQRLRRASHELYALGLDDQDLRQAVRRAMSTCLALDMPMEQHFRYTYVCHQHTILPGWSLSETAFRLVLLNANPACPGVAWYQQAVVQRAQVLSKNTVNRPQ